MASYLVTGASRGIGYEFLRQLSSDPKNTVIGLVRDKASTDKKVAEDLNRSNIHIIQADITDYDAIVKSISEVSKITGGSIDYIIANAGLVAPWSGFNSLSELGAEPVRLEQEMLETFKTNVIGNVHLFNLYLPLVRNGKAKKVITISTGMADDEMTRKYEMDQAGPYSMSKAAMNTAVAKFDAAHRKEGILFMGICPGMVDTGHFADLSEEKQQKAGAIMAKFLSYAPNFTGPATTESSVKDVLSVVNKASIEEGYGGSYLSHLGNKQWL